MTQTQFHAAIAARTGEPLSVIRRLGFSPLTRNPSNANPEHIRLVLCCPFCRHQVPYPGRARDGSNALAECADCDVYFEFQDREVFPTSSIGGQAIAPARTRYLPA
jgi:hypothetical protein